MKIAFICGAFEPGKDGVGDYVRLLGTQLITLGHHVGVIALNDSFIENVHASQEPELSILRIPSLLDEKTRFDYAKEWIHNFDPEWLSLQFVIFSHHPKGLPFGIGKKFSLLGLNRKWHIMFHEIWIGINRDIPLKRVIWGRIQRIIIQSIISNLKPRVIHTQSNLYKALLKRIGYNIKFLPLFSNVPYQQNSFKKLNKTETKTDISFVIFGTIHPDASAHNFIDEVSEYAKVNEKSISLTIVGRSGDELDNWVNYWKSKNLDVVVLGETSLEVISDVLNNSTIGITTSAWLMVEKSGTVAAMLEHGLPVICVAKQWLTKGLPVLEPVPGVFEYQNGNFARSIDDMQRSEVEYRLEKIAKQFIIDLS